VTILIDGRRIGYDDSGGLGVPVVLLHGFPLDRTIWDEQLAALAPARVLRVDLPGCGESEPYAGPALMESLAGDVAGLLDALGIERAAFAGHSIGGYVALAFFRMYSERVAGLALVASHVAADASAPGSGSNEEQRVLAASRDTLAARLESDGTMEAAIESYLPRYFAPHVYREQPGLAARVRAVMARQDPRGCAQLIRGMKQRLAGDDLLEDIHVPALVIAGEEDAYLPPAALRETATRIANATFVELPRVGHLPMWEAPTQTADALAAWYRSNLR
jgi:pimeloyl-ACP methyl ester carboxylesterase